MCLARCVGWANVLPHLSQPNGFSPVWVRIWLFSVVAPEKEREQKPHLNGFSPECLPTWTRKSVGFVKDSAQWPHLYGFTGLLGHTWTWSKTLCVKVLLHCPHCHMLKSSIELHFVVSFWGPGSSSPLRRLLSRSPSVDSSIDARRLVQLSADDWLTVELLETCRVTFSWYLRLSNCGSSFGHDKCLDSMLIKKKMNQYILRFRFYYLYCWNFEELIFVLWLEFPKSN